jgi:hypothetical protein
MKIFPAYYETQFYSAGTEKQIYVPLFFYLFIYFIEFRFMPLNIRSVSEVIICIISVAELCNNSYIDQ